MIVQHAVVNLGSSAERRVSNDAPDVVAESPRQSAAPPHPTQAREPTPKQLQHAVQAMNHAMEMSSSSLKFSVDPETEQRVVKVVDSQTGDVIRQIPSKEALAVAASIEEFLQRGVLLKQKA